MTILKKATGYTPADNEYEGPGGTYVATLIEIGDRRHQPAGQYPARDIETWTWAIDAGEYAGQTISNPFVTAIPEDGAIHEKSKAYGYLSAMLGGVSVLERGLASGQLDIDKHVIGRQCQVTIDREDEESYPRLTNVAPMPTQTAPQQPTAAPAASQPTNGTVTPQPQPAPPAADQQPVDAASEQALDNALPF